MTYKPVKTTNTSTFDEGNGNYFVMAPSTVRTFTSHPGAIDHASNLIYDGGSGLDEYLIVKVIGRVRKKPVPLEYISEE